MKDKVIDYIKNELETPRDEYNGISAATYGLGDGLPTNIYGWSKKLAEEYGLKACEKFVALRYFNVYGPGEEHKGKMASL